MRWLRLVLVLAVVGCLVVGYAAGKIAPGEQFVPEYFQHKVGNCYHFHGTGSLLATMDWEVVEQEKNRVQIVQTIRGAKAALVYRWGPQRLELIYYGEDYPYENHLWKRSNIREVVLQAPLRLGSRWQDKYTEREIVALDEVVELSCGRYEALKVKKQYRHLDAVEYEYYVRGMGLVKSEYRSGEIGITTKLEELIPVKGVVGAIP